MGNLFNNLLEAIGFPTEEGYEDSYENDMETYNEPVPARFKERRPSRVVKLHESPSSQMRVIVVQPEAFEEAKGITNYLKERRPIILNLESVATDKQRLIDFLSGAAHALDGEIVKISNGIFLITPNNVDVASTVPIQGTKGNFPWA